VTASYCVARPRPAAATQSSACEHDNAAGLTFIPDRGWFFLVLAESTSPKSEALAYEIMVLKSSR